MGAAQPARRPAGVRRRTPARRTGARAARGLCMNRRRRRSPLSRGRSGLDHALALAPLAASLPTSTPADSGRRRRPTRSRSRSPRIRPIAPQPGDTLVLNGHPAQRLRQPRSPTSSTTSRSRTAPVGTRGEFDTLRRRPRHPADRILQPPRRTRRRRQPIGSGTWRIGAVRTSPSTSTRSVSARCRQVGELAVSVAGDTDAGINQSIGHLRTFLPWSPRNAGGTVPAPGGLAWPLADRPHRTTATDWFDDDLAGELVDSPHRCRPTGRTCSMLAAAAERQQPFGRGIPTDPPTSRSPGRSTRCWSATSKR